MKEKTIKFQVTVVRAHVQIISCRYGDEGMRNKLFHHIDPCKILNTTAHILNRGYYVRHKLYVRVLLIPLTSD